jgi:hypothetical protein
MGSSLDDARKLLRSMWQLPAAWRVLRLLARPLALAAPSPQALEDALLSPADHAQIVANMHGRILGLSAGKSSDARWIATTARFIRSFPGTFGPILGHQPHRVSSGDDGDAPDDQNGDALMANDEMPLPSRTKPEDEIPDQDGVMELVRAAENEDDVGPMEPKVFKTMEEYAALAPSVRLLVLQSIAEMVICEHDTLLHSGNFADIEADELRLEPVGVDALGSVYWYFGDERSLYREPNERVSRSREKRSKEAAAEEAKIAAEAALERQKRERKERQIALKQSKAEKWAPRVAATRSTRASLAREREIMQELEPTQAARRGALYSDSDQRVVSADCTSGPRTDAGDGREEIFSSDAHQGNAYGSRNKSRDFDDGSGAENQDDTLPLTPRTRTDSGLRRSGRARKESQLALETYRTSSRKRTSSQSDTPRVNSPAQVAKKPRRTPKKEFHDSSLRNCSGWEMVCTGPEELRAFIARFGPVNEISHSAESALVRRLGDELLPILDDASDRIKREEEKRLRAEWLASNLKKSSRVTALEQKREKEQALAAAKAAEEALQEKLLAERECRIESGIQRLEKDIVRELRLARRKLELSSGDERTASVAALSREDRAHRRQLGLAQGGSGSDAGLSDFETPTAGTDMTRINAEMFEHNHKPTKMLVSKVDSSVENAGSGQVHPTSLHPEHSCAGNALANNMASWNQAADTKPRESGRIIRTSTAALEEDIPATYTWIVVADDNLPTRALTHFIFVRASDLSLAPLEEASIQNDVVDNGRDTDIFGYGIIIPPTSSDAAPLRVELGHVLEWVIEYGTEPRLWVKTKLAWYELKSPLSDYSKTFSSALRKFEICSRLRILAQTFRGDQLAYENVVQLLAMRYMDMRGYREEEIGEEIPFILEQVQTLGKVSLLKSGFIRELEKKQRDVFKIREKEAHRIARDQERVRQLKIRAEKREAEKARLHAERVASLLERSRLAEERKRRRLESSSTKSTASRGLEDVTGPSEQMSTFSGIATPIPNKPTTGTPADSHLVLGLDRPVSIHHVDMKSSSPKKPTSEKCTVHDFDQSLNSEMIALVPVKKASDIVSGGRRVLVAKAGAVANEGPSSSSDDGIPVSPPNRDADPLPAEDQHVMAEPRGQARSEPPGFEIVCVHRAAAEQEKPVSLAAAQPVLSTRSVGHGLLVSASSSVACADGEGEHLPVSGSNRIYTAPGFVEPSPIKHGQEGQNEPSQREQLPSRLADKDYLSALHPCSTGQLRLRNLDVSCKTVEAIHACPNDVPCLNVANEIAANNLNAGDQARAQSSAHDRNLADLRSPALSRKVANSTNFVALGPTGAPPLPEANGLHKSLGHSRSTAPSSFDDVLPTKPNVAERMTSPKGRIEHKAV